MAAVLCNAVCVAPCNAIGKGCSACCDGCGKCCKPLGDCADAVCSTLGEACMKPFSCCATVTITLAAVGFVLGIIAFIPEGTPVTCDEGIAIPFLAISLALCAGHILFVLYLFRAINRPKDGQGADGESWIPGTSSVFRDAWGLFLNDVPMALYILFFIFSFVWAILGQSWMRDCPDGSNERTYGLAFASILIAYGVVAASLFFGTLMALCCCGGYYSERDKQRRDYREQQAKNTPRTGNLAPSYYDVEDGGSMKTSQQPPPQQGVVYHQPVVSQQPPQQQQQQQQYQQQQYQQPAPVPAQGTVGTPQQHGAQQQSTATDQAIAVVSTVGRVGIAAGRGAFSAAKSAWKGRKK